jgi:hypothetical protein
MTESKWGNGSRYRDSRDWRDWNSALTLMNIVLSAATCSIGAQTKIQNQMTQPVGKTKKRLQKRLYLKDKI